MGLGGGKKNSRSDNSEKKFLGTAGRSPIAWTAPSWSNPDEEAVIPLSAEEEETDRRRLSLYREFPVSSLLRGHQPHGGQKIMETQYSMSSRGKGEGNSLIASCHNERV